MFIDTHSHIFDSGEFADIDEVFARCDKAKVSGQMIVSYCQKSMLEVVGFVRRHTDRDLWSVIGVHPHNANEVNSGLVQKLRNLALDKPNKVVAIGEIGLDYYRNLQSKEVQAHAFRMQMELARELGLPVVVHVRDAWDDALEILKEFATSRVVLHCFSGSLEQARAAWKRGYMTSFTAVVTYPKNDDLRAIVAAAPSDQYMIETDCPYLPPQAMRGKRNEPAFVVDVAREVAAARGMGLEAVGRETTDNAMRFFQLSSRA